MSFCLLVTTAGCWLLPHSKKTLFMFLATVHGQSRGHVLPVKTSIEGGLSDCVPAVDTGTQSKPRLFVSRASNQEQVPAIHAGIAPRLQSHVSR